MSAPLLNSSDIQALLRLGTPKAAERLMDRWCVPFIHLGRGRGLGRRWSEEKVLAAVKQREKDPTVVLKAKKQAPQKTIFDGTLKDALRLTRPDKRA